MFEKLNTNEKHHVKNCAMSNDLETFIAIMGERAKLARKRGSTPCLKCFAIAKKLGLVSESGELKKIKKAKPKPRPVVKTKTKKSTQK